MADLSCSATMANPNRKRGRPRLFTTPEKKKKFYKMLGRRVFLGDTFVEWRNLREKLGMNRESPETFGTHRSCSEDCRLESCLFLWDRNKQRKWRPLFLFTIFYQFSPHNDVSSSLLECRYVMVGSYWNILRVKKTRNLMFIFASKVALGAFNHLISLK